MEKYRDEEIIRERLEEKKKAFNSVHTGMYAGDILLNFVKKELFHGKIHILLPEQFKEMEAETAKRKYPSENRPDRIFTDSSGEVDFTFSLFEQSVSSSQIEGSIGKFKALLRKSRQDVEIIGRGSFEAPGISCGWFDFRNHAIDEVVYNLLAIAGTKKYMILSMFNCVYEDRDKWKEVMEQILRSIEEEG